MQRNRPSNNSVKPNPAGQNNAAPSSLPKGEVNRSAPHKGVPKSIPSTMGYAGRKIK